MENAKIYTALCAITKEIGAIGKDKKNQQQGFMFRGVDQVMNVLHPLLSEFGVFIVPEVIESHREERQTKSGGNLIYTIHKIKFHFTAMDGSEVCATVVGEGMDSADKSSNKAMAVAFKYACFQVFCVPTEEIAQADPDGYSPEESTITLDQLKQYLSNCNTKADLAMFCENWGHILKANPDAMKAYQTRKGEVMKGNGK